MVFHIDVFRHVIYSGLRDPDVWICSLKHLRTRGQTKNGKDYIRDVVLTKFALFAACSFGFAFTYVIFQFTFAVEAHSTTLGTQESTVLRSDGFPIALFLTLHPNIVLHQSVKSEVITVDNYGNSVSPQAHPNDPSKFGFKQV